jgi:two-component system, OmpR family, alkaline phosphatase synthesis response regulator PhoP
MPKHIMIVDDEVDIVETVRLRLQANGYQVSNSMGEQALEDIRKAKPDLILLDIIMPGMDGFAVIRELKRDPELFRIPVIIFSAKPKAAMIELFGPEGIAGYISKPYDARELLDQIKQILGA